MISILFLGAVISVIFMVLFVILGSAFLSNSTLNKLLSKKIIIISSICIIIISMILSFKIFTNMIWYNYDSKETASKGILFKDTLILSEHRLIGTSDLILFKIDKYSRSDRQLEVINVIVNQNKEK